MAKIIDDIDWIITAEQQIESMTIIDKKHKGVWKELYENAQDPNPKAPKNGLVLVEVQGKKIGVHGFIWDYYFAKDEMIKQEEIITIPIEFLSVPFSAEAFSSLVKYFYTGCLEHVTSVALFDIICLGNHWDIKRLPVACWKALSMNNCLSIDNVGRIIGQLQQPPFNNTSSNSTQKEVLENLLKILTSGIIVDSESKFSFRTAWWSRLSPEYMITVLTSVKEQSCLSILVVLCWVLQAKGSRIGELDRVLDSITFRLDRTQMQKLLLEREFKMETEILVKIASANLVMLPTTQQGKTKDVDMVALFRKCRELPFPK